MKYIDDFINIAEKQNISCGEIVAYFHRKAIKYAKERFNPKDNDYAKAYKQTLKAYAWELVSENENK